MYNNGNGGGNNGNNGGNGNNGNGGGWGGRSNGPQCYKCGKYGHIARECWMKKGRPAQQDDEVHLFVRDLMKEREEKRKREEEEEKQRLKVEKERKRELDLARRTEEMRLQLQAEIAEKWRKQQEEAAEKIKAVNATVVEGKGPKSPKSPKTLPKSKSIRRSKEKRNDTKTRRRKMEVRRLVVTSSSSETDEDSSMDSDGSTDSDRGALKIIKKLREAKKKNKGKKSKANTVRTNKKDPPRTWEKGECSKRSYTPVSTLGDDAEPKTPLTKGYKGIAAGCSQEAMVDYTLSVMKQLSSKKVSELKEMCEKHSIKPAKKDEMVRGLVRKQTEVAYDGFFTTLLAKKTTSMRIGEEKPRTQRTPEEVVKSRIITRGKAKMTETPRVVLRSATSGGSTHESAPESD
ncbi:hypothetical protein CBR_g46255 [Chara braunii]|uniref:CCHC-type domain-containing protein n=1 Tax=Chara braunii TaxID=69332 RepID=A0A388K3S6_CHABU|nr:hypothetical protein CBR_g46255 [Chara braunii]|eukprot:GBG64712.1 hypothetical protein CBR_g46255 [Chara braunii]